MDRGKVIWETHLEASGGQWGRYKDVDGDAIPYRTVPGNRHSAAAYFCRGTGHDEQARYSENNKVWHDMLDRLKRKFDTARQYMPKPVIETAPEARFGIISFGSTDPAIEEARDLLAARGYPSDYLRLRALPFTEEVESFLLKHRYIYVVEMNRDGQLHQLLKMEYTDLCNKVESIAYTDGLPLTARFVADAILAKEEK